MPCAICQSQDLKQLSALSTYRGENKNLLYWHCGNCDFIALDAAHRLNYGEEKERYETHNNDEKDVGYLGFLQQFLNPVGQILEKNGSRKGLDFGSGPNPVLAQLFSEKGYRMEIFDPFFANKPEVFKKFYDFVTCHEVIEHCFEPLNEIKKMHVILEAEGILAFRTQLHPGPEHFAGWWYRKDPTHVSFFSRKTFDWLASRFKMQILFANKDTVVLKLQQ